MYFGILGIVVLFVLLSSAYLSFAEASLSNVSFLEVKTRTDKKDKNAIALRKIIEDKDKYVAAILILNVAVNIGGSIAVGALASIAFDNLNDAVNMIFYVAFTMSILYFTEMIPKLYAIQNSLKVSLKVSRVILSLHFIIGFLVKLSVFICSPFIKKNVEPSITMTDVKGLIKIAKKSGLLKFEEANIIKNTLKLGEKTVSDIMLKVDDIEYLPSNLCIMENQDLILSLIHNRIIVAKDGDINNPIGVVLKSQLLETIVRSNMGSNVETIKVQDLMHVILIIEETDNLSHSLIEFNENEDHLAIVHCKDGTFKGILSSEDILDHITMGYVK